MSELRFDGRVVIVTGGDAGKQYVVNAVVEEFQEAVRPQVAAV